MLALTRLGEAFEYGAIKTLFITDALYRPRTVEERKKIEDILNQAAELRVKICVIPVIHESGEKLKAMVGLQESTIHLQIKFKRRNISMESMWRRRLGDYRLLG